MYDNVTPNSPTTGRWAGVTDTTPQNGPSAFDFGNTAFNENMALLTPRGSQRRAGISEQHNQSPTGGNIIQNLVNNMMGSSSDSIAKLDSKGS